MEKRIICKNKDNTQVIFEYAFNPFFLVSCDGITTIQNNVNTMDNTNLDGATYIGSNTTQRNIVITAQMYENYQSNRNLLYTVFRPKSWGAFIYAENDETYSIDYQVESLEIGETGVVRDITISLLCPNPFFIALDDITVDMAAWYDLFEFEHEFDEEGEEFGSRKAEIIKAVPNESGADGIGITIDIHADGIIENPAIYHLESGDYIIVGITLQAGDILTITTHTNDKNVYLTRDGEKTGINNLLDEDSEFMQLDQGENTFKYDAQSGIDYMNVSISYRVRYLGV